MKSAFPPQGIVYGYRLRESPEVDCYECRGSSITHTYFRAASYQSVMLALDEYCRSFPSGGYYTDVKYGPKKVGDGFEACVERYSSCE